MIGFGVAGAFFHAPLVESTEGMALATVVTSNAERATAVGREYPGATIVGTADVLFDTAADLDLVIVASTNDTHVAFVRQAIEAGLPVVVDKPLAVGGDGAYDLVEFASARGVFLTVFQNRRWDSDFLTLQGVLESGRLGRVHRFESRFETWRPAVTGGWRESSDPALAGGVLVDLGAHLVDQAVQLFGPVHSVYGELANRRQRAEVDDDSFVSLCHTNGVRSHLWASKVAAQQGPRFRVLGDRGAFVKSGLDVQESQLRAGLRPGKSGWAIEDENMAGVLIAGHASETVQTVPGRYEQFYAQVAASLRTASAPPVDPMDAVRTLRIIEGAAESAREGRAVELGELT